MGRAPGMGFLKLVVAPLVCGLLGYAVVGPHFAGKTKTGQKVQEEVARVLHRRPAATEIPEPVRAAPERSEPSTSTSSSVPAPRVSVGVRPVDSDEPAPSPRRRRRRRRHRTTVSAEAPPEATPATPATPERTVPDPASTAP